MMTDHSKFMLALAICAFMTIVAVSAKEPSDQQRNHVTVQELKSWCGFGVTKPLNFNACMGYIKASHDTLKVMNVMFPDTITYCIPPIANAEVVSKIVPSLATLVGKARGEVTEKMTASSLVLLATSQVFPCQEQQVVPNS